MAIGDIIVGIDIGTSKVSLVIGEVNNFNQVNFLSVIYNMFFVPYVSFLLLPFTLLCYVFPCLDSCLYFFIKILTPPGIDTDSKDSQRENASLTTVVTISGITIVLSLP